MRALQSPRTIYLRAEIKRSDTRIVPLWVRYSLCIGMWLLCCYTYPFVFTSNATRASFAFPWSLMAVDLYRSPSLFFLSLTTKSPHSQEQNDKTTKLSKTVLGSILRQVCVPARCLFHRPSILSSPLHYTLHSYLVCKKPLSNGPLHPLSSLFSFLHCHCPYPKK